MVPPTRKEVGRGGRIVRCCGRDLAAQSAGVFDGGVDPPNEADRQRSERQTPHAPASRSGEHQGLTDFRRHRGLVRSRDVGAHIGEQDLGSTWRTRIATAGAQIRILARWADQAGEDVAGGAAKRVIAHLGQTGVGGHRPEVTTLIGGDTALVLLAGLLEPGHFRWGRGSLALTLLDVAVDALADCSDVTAGMWSRRPIGGGPSQPHRERSDRPEIEGFRDIFGWRRVACVGAGCRAVLGFVGTGDGGGVRLSWLLRALRGAGCRGFF